MITSDEKPSRVRFLSKCASHWARTPRSPSLSSDVDVAQRKTRIPPLSVPGIVFIDEGQWHQRLNPPRGMLVVTASRTHKHTRAQCYGNGRSASLHQGYRIAGGHTHANTHCRRNNFWNTVRGSDKKPRYDQTVLHHNLRSCQSSHFLLFDLCWLNSSITAMWEHARSVLWMSGTKHSETFCRTGMWTVQQEKRAASHLWVAAKSPNKERGVGTAWHSTAQFNVAAATAAGSATI